MKCPACRDVMIVLELEQVEVDHCVACGGVWLDGGELELLLEDAEERKKLLESISKGQASHEKSRKCPMCDRKMAKAVCGPAKQLLLDRCPKRHGFWFDRNELLTVLQLGGADRESKVVHFLQKIFHKAE